MTYELHGIKINCADGISQEEAAIYLNNQLQVMPHKTLLSLDLGLDFRKNSRTGIPLFFSAVPVLLISRKNKLRLLTLHFCFLNAKNICVDAVHKFFKAFIHTGPQPIYIPRNKFHLNTSHLQFF